MEKKQANHVCSIELQKKRQGEKHNLIIVCFKINIGKKKEKRKFKKKKIKLNAIIEFVINL